MPVVTRAQRQVSLTGIPDVRLTAAETPEAEGAGVAEAKGQQGAALANVGAKTAAIGEDVFGKIEEEGRRQGDQIAVLNAANQLGTWKNKALYDPTSGALSVRGHAALGLPEKVSADFETTADQISAGLTNPEQRIAFAKIRNTAGLEVNEVISRHTSSQIQQYQGQELESFLENSRNAAIANAGNPVLVGNELAAQVSMIRTHAPDLGFGPEEIQKQIDATLSATHVGVVENLLATNQTKSAKIYFEEAKDQIAGTQQPRLEKALNESGNRGEAQKQSDAIIAAGGTLTEQLAKARAIEDPEVRDRAVEYVEHNNSVNDKIKRENDEAASKNGFDIIDKTQDWHKIPTPIWTAASGAQRSAWMTYSDRLSSGESVETNWTTFYGLVDKAGKAPNDFANLNLLNYRGKLANGEFKQLTDLQLSMRNKEAKPDPTAEFRTTEQIVNDSLTQYGFETEPSKQSTDQKTAVAELRRRVDEQVGQLHKKDITNKDRQSIVDNILSQQSTVKGSWWGLIPFNGVPFSDTKKLLINMTIADVPQSDKEQITTALRATRRPVSDATILDAYIRLKGRGTAQGAQ